jgi:hypothetical protein
MKGLLCQFLIARNHSGSHPEPSEQPHRDVTVQMVQDGYLSDSSQKGHVIPHTHAVAHVGMQAVTHS